MGWESWLITLSVVIVALAFVALAVFIIKTLLSLRQMVNDLDQKVHDFDPLFRVVNQAGMVIERKAQKVQEFSEEFEESLNRKKHARRENQSNTAMDVAELAVIGLSLWQKIQERRRRS